MIDQLYINYGLNAHIICIWLNLRASLKFVRLIRLRPLISLRCRREHWRLLEHAGQHLRQSIDVEARALIDRLVDGLFSRSEQAVDLFLQLSESCI